MTSKLLEEYQELIEFIRNQTEYRNSLSLKINPENLEPLSQSLKQKIKKCSQENQGELLRTFFEYGPLTNLFEDESITEILLNGDLSIHIIRDGHKIPQYCRFLGESCRNLIFSKILEEGGVQINHESPHRDAQFKNFRLHVIGPPLSETIRISLRRTQLFSNSKITYETSFLAPTLLTGLVNSFTQGANMLIVGPTGSGKTSFISYLLSHLKSDERCIVLEETPEIKKPNNFSVSLNTWSNPNWSKKEFGLNDLLKQVLRMKPDRIILGEMRSDEAKDYLLSLSSGHHGSISTIHASSAREGLFRLEMLTKMGAPQWSIETIHQLICLSLKIIVVLDVNHEGIRYVKEISHIEGLGSRGPLLNPVYENSPNST